MSSTPDFKVSFGRIARTLIFEDAKGTVCFAFDVSPASGQSDKTWILHLGREALTQDGQKIEAQTEASRKLIDLALEKVREFALSRGYQVEIT